MDNDLKRKLLTILEHVALLHFCTLTDFMFLSWFAILDAIEHKLDFKINFIFRTKHLFYYVCTLLNYHSHSSYRIKPFQIESICPFK